MKRSPQGRAGLILLFFLFLVFPSLPLPAGEPASLEVANEAYSSGDYEKAAVGYRAILAASGFSPEVLYNLGNSYAQKGLYGMAIVQYLRALHLSPGDPDILGNLELTRKQAGLFADDPTLPQRLFELLAINQWALLALTAFTLFTILLTVGLFYPLKKGVQTGGGILLAAILFIAVLGILQQRHLLEGAVITATETRLLISPFASASPLGTIAEGSVVRIEKQHREYLLINDSRGRSGWIPAAALETIRVSHTAYSQEGAG